MRDILHSGEYTIYIYADTSWLRQKDRVLVFLAPGPVTVGNTVASYSDCLELGV